MTADVLRSRLTAVMQAHCLWKAQLSTALTLGAHHLKVADAAREDRCRCGQLLHGMGSERASGRWQQARQHHARFHAEAGRVLELVVAGRAHEARQLASPGGDYLQASELLLGALRSWAEEGPADRVQRHPGVAATSRRASSATAPR